MRKLLKCLVVILLSMAFFTTSIAYADETNKLKVHGGNSGGGDVYFGGPVGCDLYDSVPMMQFTDDGGEIVKGSIAYENWDNTTIGEYDLIWVFTPNDDKYETRTGKIKIRITPSEPEPLEEPTAPSLTATTVQLGAKTSYDINLNDKVPGCAYAWKSSDTKVVTVNNKNGLLKAVSEGTATVTCEITYPDDTIQNLQSEVTVGYDDNAPLLTEDDLNLNTGDVFDVNLENKVAKSKYRWVSNNKSVITVNSANGIVTAKAPGTAYVTCTITTPGNQIIVLRVDITVTAPAEVTE